VLEFQGCTTTRRWGLPFDIWKTSAILMWVESEEVTAVFIVVIFIVWSAFFSLFAFIVSLL
jgi:hypothetical protein